MGQWLADRLAAFFDSLNDNAGAIQAAATVALVWITWHYVKLTKELAGTAREQLEESKRATRAAAEVRRARVSMLVRDVLDALRHLPTDRDLTIQEVREIVWRDSSLDEMKALAAGELVAVRDAIEAAIRSIELMRKSAHTQILDDPRAPVPRSGFSLSIVLDRLQFVADEINVKES